MTCMKRKQEQTKVRNNLRGAGRHTGRMTTYDMHEVPEEKSEAFSVAVRCFALKYDSSVVIELKLGDPDELGGFDDELESVMLGEGELAEEVDALEILRETVGWWK